MKLTLSRELPLMPVSNSRLSKDCTAACATSNTGVWGRVSTTLKRPRCGPEIAGYLLDCWSLGMVQGYVLDPAVPRPPDRL